MAEKNNIFKRGKKKKNNCTLQSGLAPRWDTKHITKAHDFGGCLMWSSSSSSECRKPPKNQPSANIEWHWVRPRRPNPTSVVSLAIEFGIFYYCYYFPFSIDHHLSFVSFFFLLLFLMKGRRVWNSRQAFLSSWPEKLLPYWQSSLSQLVVLDNVFHSVRILCNMIKERESGIRRDFSSRIDCHLKNKLLLAIEMGSWRTGYSKAIYSIYLCVCLCVCVYLLLGTQLEPLLFYRTTLAVSNDDSPSFVGKEEDPIVVLVKNSPTEK